MELLFPWGRPGVPFQQGLHLFKGFAVYNRLVGISHPHPFILRHRLNLMYLIAFHTAAALYQIPGINRVGKNVRKHPISPHGII